MAVSTDFQQLRANLEVTQYDFDPDATSLTDIGWVDMRDATALMILFFRTVGTSDLTFNVIGNSQSDGGGTDVTIKSVTISSQPDAVGDKVVAEVTQQECAQAATDAGEDVRYVSAQMSFGTGTDEGVVTYIREPQHAKLDLTADAVA